MGGGGGGLEDGAEVVGLVVAGGEGVVGGGEGEVELAAIPEGEIEQEAAAADGEVAVGGHVEGGEARLFVVRLKAHLCKHAADAAEQREPRSAGKGNEAGRLPGFCPSGGDQVAEGVGLADVVKAAWGRGILSAVVVDMRFIGVRFCLQMRSERNACILVEEKLKPTFGRPEDVAGTESVARFAVRHHVFFKTQFGDSEAFSCIIQLDDRAFLHIYSIL